MLFDGLCLSLNLMLEHQGMRKLIILDRHVHRTLNQGPNFDGRSTATSKTPKPLNPKPQKYELGDAPTHAARGIVIFGPQRRCS